MTSAFVQGQPSLYPGSALQAMTLLGDQCAYLLCDMDPVSVDDLRAWSHRLNLSQCEVAQRDGLVAVREWLGDPRATVVHIDPFEPYTREEGGPSAIEMAAEVADAGHALVYWYGFDNPKQRSWAMDEIRTLTSASLWCGDFMVTASTHKPAMDGDLGEAAKRRHRGLVVASSWPTSYRRSLAGACTSRTHSWTPMRERPCQLGTRAISTWR